MRIAVSTLVLILTGASSALAHGGHIGDLAGHSHWIGWAAAAAAGAIAAWGIKQKKKNKDAGEDDGEEASAETDAEAAEA